MTAEVDVPAFVRSLNEKPARSYKGEFMDAEWHEKQFRLVGVDPNKGFADAARRFEAMAPMLASPDRLRRQELDAAARRVHETTQHSVPEWDELFPIVQLLEEGYNEDRLVQLARFVAEELEILPPAEAAYVLNSRTLFSGRIFGSAISLLRNLGGDMEEAARLTLQGEVDRILEEPRERERSAKLKRAEEGWKIEQERKRERAEIDRSGFNPRFGKGA